MTKAYFSFCYNGVPNGPRDEHTELFKGEGFNHTYAFVVDTKEPDVAFAELSREPLFRHLFGPVLFGWYDPDHLVIGSKPDMVPELVSADPLGVLRVKTADGGIFKLPIRELERTCTSAVKYGLNCRGCPRHAPGTPGECYLRQVLKHTRKLGWNPKRFLPPETTNADEYDPKDLDKFIRRAVKNGYALSNGYQYVPPRTARDDLIGPDKSTCERGYKKVGYLRYYDTLELDVSTIDCAREEASARSYNAAATRKLQKRCKDHCVFAPCNRFARRACRSWVDGCLDQKSGGPFTEEEIARRYRAWMKTFTRARSLEEIAFIAYHGGSETRVFGCEMTLAGFDKHLDKVEFTGYRNQYSRFFTYEDAVEILRTPWWCRDGSGYDRVKLFEPWEMKEEHLWAYAQIRQFSEAPGYATRWGYAYPQITSVEWTGVSFNIKCHCGHDRSVCSLRETCELFGVEDTLRSNAITQALEEEDCPEPNQDTQP